MKRRPPNRTAYRLAKHDAEKIPRNNNRVKQGKRNPVLYKQLSSSGRIYRRYFLGARYPGRTSNSLYVRNGISRFPRRKLPDWKAAATLVRKIAENYSLPDDTLSPMYSVCKNHGYISGEHFECPDCGEHTEVYSRITGYYRPVQNWNDGKAQEYKERKVYNIATSKFTRASVNNEETNRDGEEQNACGKDAVYLFTTETCPNCKIATATLDRAGFGYEKTSRER